MADRAREKGRTKRYLPKAAWVLNVKEERKATDEKKKNATRGKPVNTHVANTEKANGLAKKLGRTKHLKTMAKQGPCWDGYVMEGMKKVRNREKWCQTVRAKKKVRSYKKSKNDRSSFAMSSSDDKEEKKVLF